MLDTFHVQDPAALRAIAHPIRQRILSELAALGHARAADLAQVIDEPANSVSFHLRVLAKAGMIEEAPEHARDRRERVWANTAQRYFVDPGEPEVVREIVRPALSWAERLFVEENDSTAQQDDRMLAIVALVLTPAQAAEMAQEVADLLERWSDRSLTGSRDAPRSERGSYQALAVLAPHDAPQEEPKAGDDGAS